MTSYDLLLQGSVHVLNKVWKETKIEQRSVREERGGGRGRRSKIQKGGKEEKMGCCPQLVKDWLKTSFLSVLDIEPGGF